MLLYAIVVIVATSVLFQDVAGNIDSSKCNIYDPDLSNCVSKALNSLRPKNERGTQQTASNSFDPFIIPAFEMIQESQVLNYTVTCRNYTLRGMGNFEIKDVSFDPKSMTFHGRIEYGPLSANSDYEIHGILVYIPVDGKGIVRGAFGSINATVEVYGEMRTDKVTYYNPTGIKVRMVIEDLGLNLGGLFAESSELARMTNEALNSNSKMIIDGMTPALEKLSEKVFLQSIKRFSKKILYV